MIDRRLLPATAGLLSATILCAALTGTSGDPDGDRAEARRIRRTRPCGDLAGERVTAQARDLRGGSELHRVGASGRAPVHVASRSAGQPGGAAATATRGIEVEVVDRAGRPVSGVAVRLERLAPTGVWLGGARARSDAHGRAGLQGFEVGVTHRIAADFPGASAPVEVRSTAPVTLSVDRPLRTVIELRSRLGHLLSGARRVEVETVRSDGSGATYRSLEPGDAPARWVCLAADRIDATVHVTDTLGRPWRDRVTLIPGEKSVVTPGPEWIAIARTEAPGARREDHVEQGRLRWSLRVGDRAPRRGSGPLARGGAFHAVVARDPSRAHGGTLELRWNADEAERSTGAAWHPDPTLEHVALNTSPIGEVLPIPSSHIRRP